ncbi:MAG: hypothetical protein RLY43_976 [Bacteroidota bacterium]
MLLRDEPVVSAIGGDIIGYCGNGTFVLLKGNGAKKNRDDFPKQENGLDLISFFKVSVNHNSVIILGDEEYILILVGKNEWYIYSNKSFSSLPPNTWFELKS